MPSTKPTMEEPALSSSTTAKKRTFIPSVVNPYSEFTQPQFDAFVSDITTKIRDALHGSRKGKGKDMSLFGANTSTTSIEQGDAMGFEQYSFSRKVRTGVNGVFPLGAVEVLTDEKEQDEDTEQEEQEEVDDGVEEQILWPARNEGQEPPGPPQVVEHGTGGANDPIVIDLLDSDEEEPLQTNGKCNVDGHEESQDEEGSDEDDEDENVLGRRQNNLIAMGSDEESEHDEEQRVQVQESDQLDSDEFRIESHVGSALPASSPPDDQEDEEGHNDDTEPDHIHTPYESFVANMNTSGSAMPYVEGPGLHVETSGYTSEISDPYYSLYSFDNTSQGYVDPLRSSSQTSNRARQRATLEEGMSWTYPPAFPPRSDSVSGHGTCQSEEPHHQLFSVSSAGYGIHTSMIASYADAYATDEYVPVDETQYHSAYQEEQSIQQLPMEPTELASGVPFGSVGPYVDLVIDPSLEVPNAVNGVSQSTAIEKIQSDVPTDEPAVGGPRVDVRVTATGELEEVEGEVEESVEIPVIEIDATDVDPSALETTTYGTGALASMLTPDLRPLMRLPSPTSPDVAFFPTHEESRPQVSDIDLVDSEQLLTPDGVIHPSQKLGSLKQDIPTMPLVESPVNGLPTPEPVVKNRQALETLREELDPSERALIGLDTDVAAQDITTPPLISTTSEGQVVTLLESETSAFTFDKESQLPSTLEESHAIGHPDEKSESHSMCGSSVLSGESHQDSWGQDATVSPRRRRSMREISGNNPLSRELQGLQDDAGTIVLDGPRLRRTSSSKSGGAPAANASVRGRGRGGVVKQVSPRKRATTPMASMPPPSDVPKRNKVLRSSSRASSVASDQSFQKPPSVSSPSDYRSPPLEPKRDTTLGTDASSSAGNTPTTKKRKRRPRTSMPGDEEDYVPEEVEQAHKKRKTEICDTTEANSSLAGGDFGEVLAVAEGTPDLEAKKAIGDEGSPRKSIDASPSTLQACTAGSGEDGERQPLVTQSGDGHTDSDLTPVPPGDNGVETCEISSPSKRARKRISKLMDPQHNSYKPPTDSGESESETEAVSRRETVRRTNMPNGYEIEVLVQDAKRSTPVYEEDSDGSISDSSDGEGSLYSYTVGSTEESTTIVEGAPEEPDAKLDGLGAEPKSVRRSSRRMRRIQRDNLAYKPSGSSESEGDVEQLLEQEEVKERERRRRKALKKARRTRKKRAALAEGTVVDANTSIKSRKRKRPSGAVRETENKKGKRHQVEVEDSVGDLQPRKKRVKKDHHPTEMDKVTPFTNGVTKSDQAPQVEPVESDLKPPESLKAPSQADLTLASHKFGVLDAPFFGTNKKDKREAGAWWFGRLFSKNLT